MKIAFVYDVIYPYVKGGGERRYYELAQRLSAQHEVHLWGMKFWEGNDITETSNGVYLHGVCPPMALYVNGRRSIRQAIYYAIRLIRPFLKEDFDLIECPSAPFFPIFSCKLYALLRKRPFIVVWLEYWGDYWYEYLGRLGVIAKFIEKLASRMPDHIIAISEHTKNSLIANGVEAKMITAIPLGININEIKAVEPSTIQSDLIFVGRLIKEKNVHILLQVVQELKRRNLSIRCCIVGDGPERTNLEHLCKELSLEENILFTGFIENHKDVYALMKNSKVFTFLSTREGFGLVVPEANACGLPAIVIKDKHNAATFLVADSTTGFVCALDIQEIAKKIYELLADDKCYAMMKQAALDWAQQFDWDISAKSTEQIYRQIIMK